MNISLCTKRCSFGYNRPTIDKSPFRLEDPYLFTLDFKVSRRDRELCWESYSSFELQIGSRTCCCKHSMFQEILRVICIFHRRNAYSNSWPTVWDNDSMFTLVFSRECREIVIRPFAEKETWLDYFPLSSVADIGDISVWIFTREETVKNFTTSSRLCGTEKWSDANEKKQFFRLWLRQSRRTSCTYCLFPISLSLCTERKRESITRLGRSNRRGKYRGDEENRNKLLLQLTFLLRG